MAEQLAVEALIYVKTDATAPTDSDKLDKATQVSFSNASTVIDTTYLMAGRYETEAPTTFKVTGTVQGNRDFGSTVQGLLFTAKNEGTLVHITVLTNPDGAAGSQGWRYPCFVIGDETTLEPKALQPFNLNLTLGGQPVAV